MVLTGLEQLEIRPLPPLVPGPDEVLVHVLACAICRTDAKMWEQGHRDLIFPRVLGHEMVVRDDLGNRYIVWPGKSCGTCRYCRAGRENLCDEMKITGFHHDGGFAHRAVLPLASLVPVPLELDLYAACFAEPVGCVVNAFEKLPATPGKKILIYGGGTMGLDHGHLCQTPGPSSLLSWKRMRPRLKKYSPILKAEGLDCARETHAEPL